MSKITLARANILGQADMARLVVRGREAHIATALTNMGWVKGPSVTILAKCVDGQVLGTRYEAIGGLKNIEIPLVNLDGDTNCGVAVVNLKDLSKFTWPEKGATSDPRNLSHWRDGLEITV